MEDLIYLDYNATTPLLPEVVGAMLPFLRDHFGNPSSAHAIGRAALAAVDTAREQVAALLHCDAGEVVFTSGGTESNNLAIRSVHRLRLPRGRRGGTAGHRRDGCSAPRGPGDRSSHTGPRDHGDSGQSRRAFAHRGVAGGCSAAVT